MDAPLKDLDRIKALLQAAREALQAGRHAEAVQCAREALGLDALNPRPAELLAEIHRAAGQPELAARDAALAKYLREQAWQRQVEAEARGHHDLIGEASRHELP
jgi:two-component SAPR family response regulator